MAVVQKEDWISLAPTKGEDTTIKWQQNLVDKTKVFKVIPFVVKDGTASGTLFLESGLASQFLKQCEKDGDENPFAASDNYKIQVTDAMQYGQDKADNPAIRFLVYHDKSDNIYQHRFMQTQAFGSIMYKVSDKVQKIPTLGQYLKELTDLAKGFIGDPLRNF